MTQNNGASDIIDAYTKFLNTQSCLVFSKFSSSYKRKKFYDDELGFIKPEEVLLTTSCTAPIDNNEDMTIKSSFGYYIPFEKSLAKTMKCIPRCMNLNYNQNHKKFKDDFNDGDYIKKRLKTNELAILIYTDDLELTNPIGSSRTKHKLSMKKSFIYWKR